jgi:hypothetical protein
MFPNNNIQRLSELNVKVANNTATNAEKEELMHLLLANGSITQKQFDDFLTGRNVEQLMKTALIVAGIILLGQLLQKAIK